MDTARLSALGDSAPTTMSCWAFEDRREFVRAAVDFLRDGLDLGQRLFYVGDRPEPGLADDLDDLGNVGVLVDSGALILSPVEGFCDLTTGVVPEAQLQFCDEQVDQALLDGFTGVRFAAEVTRLASQPLSWANHTAGSSWPTR